MIWKGQRNIYVNSKKTLCNEGLLNENKSIKNNGIMKRNSIKEKP